MVDATVELWMRRSAGMLSRGGSETDTDVLQVFIAFKSQQKPLVDRQGGTKQGFMSFLAICTRLYRDHTTVILLEPVDTCGRCSSALMDRNESVLELGAAVAGRGNLESGD